jgi:putative flippase GtrA
MPQSKGALTQYLMLLFSGQFIKFVFAGGFAALVNWGSRIWLSGFVSFRFAVVVAYAFGMATAFVLNKRFVFVESGRALKAEINYFIFFNIAALPIVWLASVFLAEYLMPKYGFKWYPQEVAHGIAISLPLFINFFLHKFVTFKENDKNI